MTPTVATVLRALADLAPTSPRRVLDVTRPGQPLIWLSQPDRCPPSREVERLAAADLLHADERTLRRAWGLVAGAIEVDGVRRRVRLPLVSEPVRLERRLRGYRVVSAGDLEITPLVEDRAHAARLEVLARVEQIRRAETVEQMVAARGPGTPDWISAPGTEEWLRAVAEAASLPVTEVDRTVRAGPATLPTRGLVLYVATALFSVRDVAGVGLADGLRAWAGRPGLDQTALATVYGLRSDPTSETDRAVPSTDVTAAAAGPDGAVVGRGGGDATEPVRSPMPLNETQIELIRRVRHQPLTVLSGPPGNGKSHAVVAAAIDAVDRGGSVLVVTQSSHAADVLADLLQRYPGPVPVLFGDAERREAIAQILGRGPTDDVVGNDVLAAAEAAVARAAVEVDRITAELIRLLELERLAESVPRWEPRLPGLRLDVPGVFAAGVDLDAVTRALGRIHARADVRWRRWLPGRPGRRLRRRLGAAATVSLDRIAEAVEAARALAAAAALATVGGGDLDRLRDELLAAEEALAAAVGTAMRDRARSAARWDGAARRSAAALSTALRAGRHRRRELIAGLDGAALVRALPLWVGTVTDVEELLPPVPGLFDLVILDEASHTDQIRAAPVLARARRALVVGDPRQLRFVSFVADVDVTATLERHGLDSRVDVRRVSAFDLAAGAAPTIWLDEHHRSAPHLIEFSAHRFYAGRIAVATRHPGNETADVIDVVRVPGATVEAGVNRAEVEAAVAEVRRLAAAGEVGIGVVTPFRAQASALEAALIAAFPVTEIERIGLRVGTVHAFQGSEVETVVLSLALSDPAPAGRLRFLADPNLFNVMVTRARRRMVVLCSLSEPDGLLGEYLRYADAAPRPRGEPYVGPPDTGRGEWTDALAAELHRIGVPVRLRYPVGHWTVDLCAGSGAGAVGLVCRVHPDGAVAHLRRHRALRRAGWTVLDAFPSRWAGDPVRAALELVTDRPTLRSPGPPVHR